MRPISDDEVAARFSDWLDVEAERNPAVEAEAILYYESLDEANQRSWREHFGNVVPIEVTTKRFHQFLADNPDVLQRWLA